MIIEKVLGCAQLKWFNYSGVTLSALITRHMCIEACCKKCIFWLITTITGRKYICRLQYKHLHGDVSCKQTIVLCMIIGNSETLVLQRAVTAQLELRLHNIEGCGWFCFLVFQLLYTSFTIDDILFFPTGRWAKHGYFGPFFRHFF